MSKVGRLERFSLNYEKDIPSSRLSGVSLRNCNMSPVFVGFYPLIFLQMFMPLLHTYMNVYVLCALHEPLVLWLASCRIVCLRIHLWCLMNINWNPIWNVNKCIHDSSITWLFLLNTGVEGGGTIYETCVSIYSSYVLFCCNVPATVGEVYDAWIGCGRRYAWGNGNAGLVVVTSI